MRIWPTASWPCIIANALPLEFRRSCGTTRSPPTPRLGPNIWRQQANLPTRLAVEPSREYGENIAGFYPDEPMTKWQAGWIAEKNHYHGGPLRRIHRRQAPKRSVITRRWSGGPRNRSVAGPPVVVVIHSAFWCANTARQATSLGRSRIRRTSFLSR